MANSQEREAVAEFLRELYDLGGFGSWGEFARDAGVLASTMSDWKRGKNAPSGPSLLRLIHVASDRAPLALREAAERTSPLRQIHDRLRALEEAVAESTALTREALVLLREAQPRADGGRATRRRASSR